MQFEDEMKPARPIDATYDNPDPFAHRTHRSSDEFEEGEEGQVGHYEWHSILVPIPSEGPPSSSFKASGYISNSNSSAKS